MPYAPTRIRTRPFHFIRGLVAHGHDVTLATLWTGDDDREAIAQFEQAGCAVIAEPLPKLQSGWNCLRALAGSDPLQAHFSWHPGFALRLQEFVKTASPDAVHVEHLRGARYGLAVRGVRRSRDGRRPVVLWDSVDCISSLFRRASRESESRSVRLMARLELPRTERYEGRLLGRFDQIAVTSAIDRAELLELQTRQPLGPPPPPVHVIPQGVDAEYFSPDATPRDTRTIVMTGKMSYHANATSLLRFVHETMPSVWARRRDVRLLVVGKDPSREIRRLEEAAEARATIDGKSVQRIVVTGTVPDVRPYLRSAALAVAPIRYGVGVQNKVLEAMSCGTPMVATPQAVSALAITPGEHAIVGADAAALADGIVSLLNDADRRSRIGAAGRAFVTSNHDWTALINRLVELYARPIAS